MKINPAYKVRKMADTFLVVCQGKSGAEMTHVINLNATAVELWKAFEGKDFTQNDVAEYLVGKYEIDMNTALNDAAKWIDNLKNCNIITE